MSTAPKGILRAPKYSLTTSIKGTQKSASSTQSPRQVKSLADLVKSSIALNEEVRLSVVDEEQGIADEVGPIISPIQNEEEDVTSVEDVDESDNEAASDDETVGSEDDEILMMLGLNNEPSDDSDTEQIQTSEKGSFRKLWEVLVQWATPLTIQLVCQFNNIDDMPNQYEQLSGEDVSDGGNKQVNGNHSRNTIDVGSSRRAGIMNMIRMNISRSLSELKTRHNVTDRRKVEKSLADLVNTFDCSGAVADFDTKLWRGMTTVLIAIVSPTTTNNDDTTTQQLPKSIAAIGIVTEEYVYLTERALIDLNQS